MDLTPYYQMIDNCIKKLGIDPELCKGEKEGQWNLKTGSANVWIDVFKRENEPEGYFQCMGPVCALPTANREAFYQEILEINHTLYGVGMTKYNEDIFMKTIRELSGIDESEIMSMIQRIGIYADKYDDYLINKYLR